MTDIETHTGNYVIHFSHIKIYLTYSLFYCVFATLNFYTIFYKFLIIQRESRKTGKLSAGVLLVKIKENVYTNIGLHTLRYRVTGGEICLKNFNIFAEDINCLQNKFLLENIPPLTRR